MDEEFDYFGSWDEQDKKESNEIVNTFSRGSPRKGLKGKYLKVKGKLPGQRWPSKKKKKKVNLDSEEQEEFDRLKSLKRGY